MDKGRNLLAILLMTALAPVWTAAQQVPTKHFMTPDGLPHQQVRNFHCDDAGFVWISTLGGIGLYDGQQVRHMNNCPELNQENLSSIFVDGNNIWATTLHQLLRCSGESLFSYSFRDLQGFGHFLYINSRAGEPLRFYNNHQNAYLILTDTEDSATIQKGEGKLLFTGTYTVYSHDEGIISDSGFYSVFESVNPNKKPWKTQEDVAVEQLSFIDPFSGVARQLDTLIQVQKVFISSGDSLILVANKNSKNQIFEVTSDDAPKFITDLPIDPSKPNTYLINGSIYTPATIGGQYASDHNIELEDRVLVSSDEGFWVFFFNGLRTLQMQACKYPWSVFQLDSQICISCYRQGIHALDREGEGAKLFNIPLTSWEVYKRSPSIHSNTATNGQTVLLGSYTGFFALQAHEGLKTVLTPDGIGVESFDYRKEDQLFYLGCQALYAWNETMETPSLLPRSEDAIQKIYPVHDIAAIGTNIWAAGQSGMVCYSLEDSTIVKSYNGNRKMPCKTAVTILPFGDKILIGSSCGLLLYEPSTDTFVHVLNEVLDKRINQLVVSSDSLLVAVSSDLITVIDLKVSPWEVIYKLDNNSGVEIHEPSENGAFIADNKLVYMPHSQGVQVLDLDFVRSLKKRRKAQSIPYFLVNTDGREHFHLSQKPVILEGNSASFTPLLWQEYGKNWEYRFISNNADPSPWTTNNMMFISNLSHGKNTLLFQARTYGEPLVERTLQVMAVRPLWDRQIVRQTLAGFLVILLITFGLLRYRYQLRERKFSYDLAINKLRTIQTFFNPHFLLNALSSLQYAILYKTKEESNALLVSLSRTFHTLIYEQKESGDPLKFITLSVELQLVKDIAFLFNAQHAPREVKLDITIDSSIDPEATEVPQLLIEPFVENAYKHAFGRKKTSAPVVRLDITRNGPDLVFSIIDNGSGFALSSGNFRKSQSMKLAYERIRLLNAIKKHCTLDIQSTQGEGTCVVIRYRAEK